MNKKLKKMLATVSAVAMCAVSVVSTNVGAQCYISNNGIIFEDFTEFGDDNGVTGMIDGKICGYGRKVATRDELTFISEIWLDFTCYSQLNSEKANELSEFLTENYPSFLYECENHDDETFSINIDYPEELSYEEQFQIAVDIYKNVNVQCGGVIPAKPGTPVKKIKTPLPEPTLSGDANEDGEVNMADAVLIMQTLSNPDEYKLTPQGMANADIAGDGDGVTAMDALTIQLSIINQ